MARLATLTAENQTIGDLLRTTGAFATSTAEAHGGLASYHVTGLSSATPMGGQFQIAAGAASAGPFWVRIYFWLTTAPSAENTILRGVATGNVVGTLAWRITLDNGRLLRLYSDSAQVGSASSALQLNIWNRIEVHFDRTPAGGSQVLAAQLAVGEGAATVFASSSSLTLGQNMLGASIGGNLNSEAQTTGNWYFDDCAINDNTGSFQNAFPGPGVCQVVWPNGAGASAQFTPGGSAPESANWRSVGTPHDDPTPDDGVTFNSSSTANQLDAFAMQDPVIGALDSVTFVALQCRAQISAAPGKAGTYRIYASPGGSFTASTAITPATSPSWQYGTAQANPAVYAYQVPGTTNAWRSGDLSQMQAGVVCTNANVNPIDITMMQLIVESIPNAIAAPTVPVDLGFEGEWDQKRHNVNLMRMGAF